MTTDLVSPSLPAIATALHVSNSLAKNVISFYLLGYAIGNFSGGIVADSFGRRKLLLCSILGFILASLLPIVYANISALLTARLLQGLTLGAAAVINRTIFADIYPAEKLTKLGVLLGTVFGASPIIGPFLGGYLQYYFGWQASFIFFIVTMTIEFILVFLVVPETHFNRHSFCITSIKRNIGEILHHKEFMMIIIMMGLVLSLIVAFNIIGPFLIQNCYHYSAKSFGYLALFMGIFFLSATFACRYFLSKYSVKKLYSFYINGLLVFAIFSVTGSYIFTENVFFFLLISGIMFFSSGFIFPMSLGYGLSFFRHIAGTATAVMYLVNIALASIAGFLVSLLKIQSNISAAWIYFAFIFLIFLAHLKIKKVVE